MNQAVSKAVLVEVCVGTADDLLIAREAGADRIELNSGLPLGGLTPSPALIQEAVRLFPDGVVAMARPRAGGFDYSAADWRTLLSDVEWMLGAGVSGVAFGALTADRQIDANRVTELVRLAGSKTVVFHRAFDLVSDWRRSLELLNELGVHRVLTSGLAPTAPAGVATLREMVAWSRQRSIRILAGSGIRASNVGELVRQTGLSEIHGTFSRGVPDQGYEEGPFRFAPNDQLRVVDRDEIEAVRRELHVACASG